MAAYCTNAQAILFFDSTLLGQLVNDDGTAATEAELLSSTKLTAALEAASGELNMAARVSDRYQVSDLEGLTGNDAMELARITAWLAIPTLLGRRNPSIEQYPEIEDARVMLQAIREGVRIFDVEEAAQAGLMDMVNNTSYRTQPQLSSYCRAGRFFGLRSKYMGQCDSGGCGCG